MAECLIKRRYNDGGVKIVSWQNGTDAEIAAMIAAADAGQIDLTDYWSIGDKRTVHLGAITAGDALTTAMAAQNVVLVLMDTGAQSGYKDVDNKTVNFVVGQKDCLSATGRMNKTATNTGSWAGSAMCEDLRLKYFMALPSTFRGCLKRFKTITAKTYSGTQNEVTFSRIALFAEKEILGSATRCNTTEAEALTQIAYYKTSANRIKQQAGSNSIWWLRSPSASYADRFCLVNTQGKIGQNTATNTYGVAPFVCV